MIVDVSRCEDCPCHNERSESGEWCRLASLIANGKPGDKSSCTETYDRPKDGRMWWCPLNNGTVELQRDAPEADGTQPPT